MSYLVLDGLTKRYGETAVVEGLDLAMERGEFISLLGPSGCGKTTTLQMIAGFVAPSAGSITLNGRDIGAVPANKRGLGIVFQNYALFPHMNARQNVAFGLELQRVSRSECDRRVGEALDLVGLLGLEERYPARMSGGQQQRVALARALVIRPSVLLLDEPLSNLDAKLREEMQFELRRIQRTVGTTTLMVTHDQYEALALSDRIVIMNGGKVEQIAEPLTAYEDPASRFVAGFLGKANIFAVDSSDCETRIRIGEADIAVTKQQAFHKQLIVRPEKILFSGPGADVLPGRMKTRVFQGSHWLCQVDTSVGEVQVIRQNDGTRVPPEGEAVYLRWRAEDMYPAVQSAPSRQ